MAKSYVGAPPRGNPGSATGSISYENPVVQV